MKTNISINLLTLKWKEEVQLDSCNLSLMNSNINLLVKEYLCVHVDIMWLLAFYEPLHSVVPERTLMYKIKMAVKARYSIRTISILSTFRQNKEFIVSKWQT